MNQTFGKLLSDLVDDTAIDQQSKLEMLAEWKEKMLAMGADKLMDKEAAAHHFDWLGKIDEAEKRIAH